LEFRGFPIVVLEKSAQRKNRLLEGIFKSYFEVDVKNLADFKDISKLRDLILLLIPRLGSNVEITKLASELSLARETIHSYLSFLEQTYFIFLLPRFSKSIDRQTAGRKKVFFCDTGLANFLGQASLEQLFENNVFQILRPDHKKLHFYCKKNGSEIDFIVDDSVALEAKLSASQRDVFNLLRRYQQIGLEEGYVVTPNYSDREEVILAMDL